MVSAASKRVAPKATREWPASAVEQWAIERLKPYERNARKHPAKQIEQLRASLREFGWTMPVLVREDGTVVAGHGRLEAAKAEGIDRVPVVIARGWTESQCRAYTLADNKLGETSEWDAATLDLELADLDELGLDLTPFGFEKAEVAVPPDASPQLDGLSFAVVVRCMDETQQSEVLARLEAEGLRCEALIS